MITTAEIKAFLGITASTDDALFTTLIASAQAIIETEVGKGIVSASYVEYPEFGSSEFDLQNKPEFDLNDRPLQVFLRNTPVISVDSVVYGVDETALVVDEDYTIDMAHGIITFAQKAGEVFEDLKVTYTAGYSSAPNDLKHVCKELVKEMYQGATGTKGKGNVKSKSIADFSVTYDIGTKALENYRSVLEKYVSIEI